MGACGTGNEHEAEEVGEPRAQPLPRRPGGGYQGVEKAERIPADANRVTTTFNGTAENILWNSCLLLMKQLLSIGETVVPWPI